MAGINHLYDLYNKKGSDFINQLFNQYVTVNEKMDGSAFSFERNKENGRFSFFRRDQRNPITLVDRTLMKYYENPIRYIESLPPHIIQRIPRGWRFGLEYFANQKPVEIVYDRIPKNNLILSYIHELNDDGTIRKTIQNQDELDEWADLIGVERPPIIFSGILDEEQKSKLMDFLNTPFQDLVEKYKTQSFVRFIISTLNPSLTKSALNDDLDKDVEGIVFRFGDPQKESETVLAKMVDPIFTELAKQKSADKRAKKPSDFLGITLLDVMSFILEKGLNKFEVEGDTEDERYISFISDVFGKFLDENGEKYRGADFEEPDYLKRDEFRLNKDLIGNRKVLKYLSEDDSFESLYKLILNSFRKTKTRSGGIVTQGMIQQLNLLIQDIKDYIKKEKHSISESNFISFKDFQKEKKPEINYFIDEDQITTAEDPFYSFDEFISKLETIDNSGPEKTIVLEEEGVKKINVIMGRFQPFHNGHLKMAKVMKEKNGYPTFIVAVHPGHNKSGKSPFTQDMVEKYLDAISKNHEDIEGFMMVERGLLGSAINKLVEQGYEPHLVGAGEDRKEDYEKQMEYIQKSELSDKLPKDFKLIETPRTSSATEVREKLLDNDFAGFKKMVPKEVSNYYNNLVSSIREKH
jgi:cytidyltransferase-like protein